MNELSEVQTRDLAGFEAASLPLLELEKNIVIEEAPSRIQMLGALRASDSCRECHHVSQGSLLGAFTYVLVRSDANAK